MLEATPSYVSTRDSKTTTGAASKELLGASPSRGLDEERRSAKLDAQDMIHRRLAMRVTLNSPKAVLAWVSDWEWALFNKNAALGSCIRACCTRTGGRYIATQRVPNAYWIAPAQCHHLSWRVRCRGPDLPLRSRVRGQLAERMIPTHMFNRPSSGVVSLSSHKI